MSLERYQAQVERINKTLTAVQGTITELEDALANIEPIEDRVARMEDFVHGGQAMLTTEDISIANAFFRNHIEIWVSEGRVDEIKFI